MINPGDKIGNYQGKIQARAGEKIIALGDCACWSGKISGDKRQLVQVDILSVYKPHSQRGLHTAYAKDALRKSTDIIMTMLRQYRQPVIIVRGCPVPILEVATIPTLLGGTANPSMQPAIFPRFVYFVILSKFMRMFNRFWRKTGAKS